MAFAKSTGNTNKSEFGHVKWAMKDLTIPTPNIEFYDSATKTNSYLLSPGDSGGVQIDGVIKRVTAFAREGYNDRLNKTGEENEWRMLVVVDDGTGGPDTCVTFDLISDVGTPNRNTAQFLNTLVAHLDAGGKDHPVRLSFYKNPKGYAASSIIKSTGVDAEGRYVFENYKENLVRTEGLPPQGDPIMKDGKQVVVQGVKAWDYSALSEWVQTKMTEAASYYPTREQTQEEGADPGDAMSDDDQDASRPRQSA